MIRILSLIALFLPTFAAAQSCEGTTPCPLSDRTYHVLPPDNWNGTTPLPILLHFHGWMRQGGLIVQHQRIAGHTRRRGVLLIAPNGRGKTWDFWTKGTDDVAFAAHVIEDVAKSYPIDRTRIYVSGYSYGSAMAWRYVCQNGRDVAALIAVAGSIRQTENCPQGPLEIRHVHGRDDTVMRTPVGPGGDETYPVHLWLQKYKCSDSVAKGPYKIVDWLTFERTQWQACDDNRRVTLDLHPGGHFIPHGWIGRQLDELLGRAPTYP